MQSIWNEVVLKVPYKGFLQIEVIDKEKYLNEGFLSVAFFLAVVTILLSVTALFALVSLNIIKRNAEVAIRKILGASIVQIINIITKEFTLILFIAFVIGSGLGYLFIDKILFQFVYSYHSEIGLDAFVITLLIILMACGFTIGLKVYQAAIATPVKSLRSE